MTISRRKLLQSGLAGAMPCSLAAQAMAQGIGQARMVIGFPAGGAPDSIGRALALKLSGSYASNVFVDTKTGAAGQLAAVAVKQAPRDGSVMLVTPMLVLGVFPHTYKSLPYDALADFTAVSNIATFNYAFAVGPGVPASVTNAAQLSDWYRAKPDKASFGIPAPGSTLHFSAMLFGRAAGLNLTYAGYNSPQMFADTSSGVVSACVSSVGALLPMHNSGRLRIIATTGDVRSPFLRNVPTLAEAGYRDLVFKEWIGCFVPANTPADMVERLNQAIGTALASPEVKETMATLMLEATPSSPGALAALLRSDSDAWRQRIQSVGFTQNS